MEPNSSATLGASSDDAVVTFTDGNTEHSGIGKRARQVALCIPSGREVEEVYHIDVSELDDLIVATLQQHLARNYRLLYCDRLRFTMFTETGHAQPLSTHEHVPEAPAEVCVQGPGAVVSMLLMAMRRRGSAVRERHVQMERGPEPKKAVSVTASDVSIEAFTSNLAKHMLPGNTPLRIVFLDVDGVLNGGSSMMGLDMACMHQLALLVQDAKACFVLSSTWRFSEVSKISLLNTMVMSGISRQGIVGETPEVSESDMCEERASEICAWMDSMPPNAVANWVVLDDMDLSGSPRLQGHFVRTDVTTGLTEKNRHEALKILTTSAL